MRVGLEEGCCWVGGGRWGGRGCVDEDGEDEEEGLAAGPKVVVELEARH